MNIKRVQIFGIRLPLKEPFIVSYDRYDDMPSILVRVETENGLVGWGESVPDQHVTGETWQSALTVLEHELAPLILDEEPFQIDRIHQEMNKRILGNQAAKAAIDTALYDLMGKLTGQPVYQLIGGKAHERLQVPQVISIKSPAEMAKDAARIVSQGFRSVKIKVGEDPQTDIERIRAVRAQLPMDIELRVDANQGWDRLAACQVIEATKDCAVDWYEQPVLASDLQSLSEIRQVAHTKIMVDEGIQTLPDLLRVIKLRAADLINIKLMKTGGIYPALAIAHLAETAGLPCQVGSMVESAVGTMAGAHLSIARRIIQSNELVGPLMFTQDVATVTYEGDTLVIPEKPGLGIDVDEDIVRELTEISVEIS